MCICITNVNIYLFFLANADHLMTVHMHHMVCSLVFDNQLLNPHRAAREISLSFAF